MRAVSRSAVKVSALLGPLLVSACAGSRAVPDGGKPFPLLAGPVLGNGRSAPDPWTGAQRIEREGVTVLLGRVGASIAVRTETTRSSIATLLISRSDRVWLLHASAALGTGEYRCRSDGRCARSRDFDWSCRDPSDLPEAVACREAFRTKEGWIGNVNPEGSRVREFLVAPAKFPGDGALRLVVTVLTLPDHPTNWPAVEDASASLAIQQGALPEEARFDVSSWTEASAIQPRAMK